MSVIDEVKHANKIMEEVRAKINKTKISDYYNVPFEDMYHLYHAMKAKQAEKFIEGWVATLIGGKKIEGHLVPHEYKQNDNGDIWVGSKFEIGKNNIELKCSFSEEDTLGGGQFRFYEDVPYYMIFKTWNETQYDIFLLTKQQLINEIVTRARNSNKSAFTSSQGSGVISKMTPQEKIRRLYENVNKQQTDKIGWSFNTKTETEFYDNFRNKYRVNPEDVNRIINGV